MRVKNKLINVFKDKLLIESIILWAALIALHIQQYIASGHDYRPLMRVIATALYPIFIITGGRKGLYWFFFCYGNMVAVTTTFQNYTAFLILTLFTLYVPSMKIPTLILYAVDIIIVATYRDKTPVHLAIHAINCTMIFQVINSLYKPIRMKLHLTADEEIILKQLIEGKHQKEIDQYSQNTVTNKIKDAIRRNNLKNKEELIERYKDMITTDR